ncbi:MAG: PTPA-CTERM sorting domain-containing protein [Alkalinema sp. RU_4_3]|nr:PTPA-CTERM sorting domain-containing protein [Alkalinema sp. RU_4_3]
MFHSIDEKNAPIMKKFTQFLITSIAMTACMLSAGQARALTFTEGDAGDLMDSALNVGSATEINGVISTSSDIDLFRLTIDRTGNTTFDATPIKSKDGSQLNINMFLFNEKGNPLFSLEPRDEDAMKFDFATAAGIYFLGIGTDDMDALDAKGETIAGNDSDIVNAKGVLGGWSVGSESAGAYNIKISTIPTDKVPTPALLPGLLGFGIKALRRKKQEGDLVAVPVKA